MWQLYWPASLTSTTVVITINTTVTLSYYQHHCHTLTVLLSYCLTILLSYCLTVLLAYWLTVLLSYCLTVLLSYLHLITCLKLISHISYIVPPTNSSIGTVHCLWYCIMLELYMYLSILTTDQQNNKQYQSILTHHIRIVRCFLSFVFVSELDVGVLCSVTSSRHDVTLLLLPPPICSSVW